MATVIEDGEQPGGIWPSSSEGYPFHTESCGKLIFMGRGLAGEGSWEGQAGEPGYITMDGCLQTLQWKVPFRHRPVRLVLQHEDGSGNPSAAAYNVSYGYYDIAIGEWVGEYSHAVDESAHVVLFGEAYERQGCHWKLEIQGTSGHVLKVTPYNQYIDGDQFRGKRQGLK